MHGSLIVLSIRILKNLGTGSLTILTLPTFSDSQANGLVNEHLTLNSFKRMIFELLRAIEYLSSQNVGIFVI